MNCKNYQLNLVYSEAFYDIEITVEKYFFAPNQEIAIKEARPFADYAAKLLHVYYDHHDKKIVLNASPNDLGIQNPIIQACRWYDESLGPFLTIKSEEITLYPMMNPVCILEVSLDTFIDKIDRKYLNYFETRNRNKLTFGCDAFGVEEVHHISGVSQGS